MAHEARHITTVETCKLIRKDLAQFFPGVKFSVRTRHYGSIDIHWTNGPTQRTVDAVTKFYQCSEFDGMTDSTSYHDVWLGNERVHFAADFVMAQRSISLEFIQAVTPAVCKKYGQSIPTITADKWGNATFSGIDPTYRCGRDSLQDLIYQECHATDSRHKAIKNPAGKFRELAASLQNQIDDKRKGHDWNMTTRRANIERGMELDARHLERVQTALRVLADRWDSDRSIPDALARVASRALVEALLARRYTDARTDAAGFKRLVEAGLGNQDAFSKAAQELHWLMPDEKDKHAEADSLRELETKVTLAKIDGFFPTPSTLVDRMIEVAEIESGMSVLEPSAGKGDIAAAIRPGASLSVIECNYDLRKILTLKGFSLIADDFLAYTEATYDRILMNPPFERFQDIDHVQHAYSLLAPGGRLVAIMCESSFFRQDRKAADFRAWLAVVNGRDEKNEADAFKASDRPTGVQTRLVIIDKPQSIPNDKPKENLVPQLLNTLLDQLGETAWYEKLTYAQRATFERAVTAIVERLEGDPARIVALMSEAHARGYTLNLVVIAVCWRLRAEINE